MAKKPTYEELEQEVNLLRLMCDNVPDLIWSKDLEGRFLFVNQAMCDKLIMCGSPDKAVGKTDIFFSEQQRNAGHEHTFGETCVDSDAIIKENRTPGRFLEDGLVSNKYLVLDVHKAPFLNEDGEMIGTVGCGRDVTKEKETEEALQESEFRFRRMVENMPVGAGYVEGEKLFLNKATERITGYKPSDFQTLNQWFQNIYSEDHEIVRAYYDKDYEAGFPSSRVVSLKRKDGQIRFVEFTGYRFEGGSVWIFQDITERKRAEEALQDSRNMLRTVLDSIPSAVFWKDRDSVYLGGNRSWLKAEGLKSLEEVVGKSDYDLSWGREQSDSFREDDSRVMESGIPEYGLIERYLRADGTPAWAKTNKVPLRDADGTVTGVLGTYEDITERKRAEEALKRREEMLSAIFEQSPIPTAIGASDGSIISFNEALVELIGYKVDEMTDVTDWANRLYPDKEYRDVVWNNIRQALKGEKQDTTEFTITRKDGSLKTLDFYTSFFKDGLIIQMVDITERKRMEQELLRAQKLESVGLLAGGIAHDFNNILTVIMGNISFAKDQVKSEDEIFELLTEAEDASTRAQTLTRQLLTFAKGGVPVKETASIKNILKEYSLFVLRGSKSSCEFSLIEDLWPAEVDVGQMSQVINNIVINANQAMPKGGTIQVAAENLIIEDRHGLPVKPGRYIRISITDQGVGIAQKHLLNIFDPYFTTKQEGSGLGLATAYSIIKKHDGHITVKSQLGVGTTVHIYLPASDKAIPEKEKVKVIKGQGRILVMDDEVALRKVVGRMLAMLGYEAEFAQDGAEAIRMVKEAEKPYDAVILDLTIPGGMGGKEAINKLLEIDPELKAIVSSGYSDDPVLANFQEYGFKGIMPKPFQSQLLSKVLHEVLHGEKE
jgi:PAS domain S-box-containing protein